MFVLGMVLAPGQSTSQAGGVFPAVERRTASVAADWVIASGHSLTDAWYYGGSWPGYFTAIRDSVFAAAGGSRKATVPGSSLAYRWDNAITNDGVTNADARVDIDDYDLLVITEAGPPPRPGVPADAAQMATTLDYLFRFVENAYLNGDGGAGAETILQTINPWHAGVMGQGVGIPNWGTDFRESLVEYEKAFHYLADQTAASMRAAYPALPDDYRIWIMPCHRLWMRVWDDLQTSSVPGYTTIAGCFADEIHPNNDFAYGLSCLAFAMIYQRDPASIPGFYVPPGMSNALRDYLWAVAWDAVRTYRWAGLGGMDEGAVYVEPPLVDPSETLGSRLIAWHEPAQGGALQTAGGSAAGEGDLVGYLPDLAGSWHLTQTTAGARPTLTGGAVVHDGVNDALVSAVGTAVTVRYMIVRMRLGLLAVESYGAPVVALPYAAAAWWSGNALVLSSNHTPAAGETLRLAATAQGSVSPLRTITPDELVTVEIWHTADALAISINGEAAAVEAGAPDPAAIVRVSTGAIIDGAGGTGGYLAPVTLASLVLADALPSDVERAALRAWMESVA